MQSALAKCLAWLSPKGGDAAPPPPAQADGESKKPEKSWLATCHKSLASVKYLGFFFLISNRRRGHEARKPSDLNAAARIDLERFLKDAVALLFVAAVNIVFAAAWISNCRIPSNANIIPAAFAIAGGTTPGLSTSLLSTTLLTIFSAIVIVLIYTPIASFSASGEAVLVAVFLLFAVCVGILESPSFHVGRHKCIIVLVPIVAVVVYMYFGLNALNGTCHLVLTPQGIPLVTLNPTQAPTPLATTRPTSPPLTPIALSAVIIHEGCRNASACATVDAMNARRGGSNGISLRRFLQTSQDGTTNEEQPDSITRDSADDMCRAKAIDQGLFCDVSFAMMGFPDDAPGLNYALPHLAPRRVVRDATDALAFASNATVFVLPPSASPQLQTQPQTGRLSEFAPSWATLNGKGPNKMLVEYGFALPGDGFLTGFRTDVGGDGGTRVTYDDSLACKGWTTWTRDAVASVGNARSSNALLWLTQKQRVTCIQAKQMSVLCVCAARDAGEAFPTASPTLAPNGSRTTTPTTTPTTRSPTSPTTTTTTRPTTAPSRTPSTTKPSSRPVPVPSRAPSSRPTKVSPTPRPTKLPKTPKPTTASPTKRPKTKPPTTPVRTPSPSASPTIRPSKPGDCPQLNMLEIACLNLRNTTACEQTSVCTWCPTLAVSTRLPQTGVCVFTGAPAKPTGNGNNKPKPPQSTPEQFCSSFLSKHETLCTATTAVLASPARAPVSAAATTTTDAGKGKPSRAPTRAPAPPLVADICINYLKGPKGDEPLHGCIPYDSPDFDPPSSSLEPSPTGTWCLILMEQWASPQLINKAFKDGRDSALGKFLRLRTPYTWGAQLDPKKQRPATEVGYCTRARVVRVPQPVGRRLRRELQGNTTKPTRSPATSKPSQSPTMRPTFMPVVVFPNVTNNVTVMGVPTVAFSSLLGIFMALLAGVHAMEIFLLYTHVGEMDDKTEDEWEALNTTSVVVWLTTLFFLGCAIILVVATTVRSDHIDIAAIGTSAVVLVTTSLASTVVFGSRSMFNRTYFYELEYIAYGKRILAAALSSETSREASEASAGGMKMENVGAMRVLNDIDLTGFFSGAWTKWRDDELMKVAGEIIRRKPDESNDADASDAKKKLRERLLNSAETTESDVLVEPSGATSPSAVFIT